MRKLLFLAACAALAFVSHSRIRSTAGRCALDGTVIVPLYAVVVDWVGEDAADSRREEFCSIQCAQTFLEQQTGRSRGTGHCREVTVHDEVTGVELAAERAMYLRSEEATVPASGNHLRAFSHWRSALAFLEQYGGELVANPFARWVNAEAPAQPERY